MEGIEITTIMGVYTDMKVDIILMFFFIYVGDLKYWLVDDTI